MRLDPNVSWAFFMAADEERIFLLELPQIKIPNILTISQASTSISLPRLLGCTDARRPLNPQSNVFC